MACSLWRSTAVYLKDYWHSAHAFPRSGFPPGVLPFLKSFGLAACTKMFSTWDFRSAGAFPAFLLTELASLPAWQFAAGYAQLHGFALPHRAETAKRCVKHSLLERPCLPYKHKACLGRAWDVSVRSAFRKSKKSLSGNGVSDLRRPGVHFPARVGHELLVAISPWIFPYSS